MATAFWPYVEHMYIRVDQELYVYKVNQFVLGTPSSSFIFKLGSGCNLDKDLSKSERDNQLVKHKDIRLYLLLYTYRPCVYRKAFLKKQ